MNIKQDIKPISYIKSNIADVIKKINETHNPVIITQNGEAKGVFIDTESYQNMQNTILLMKLLINSENEIDNNTIIDQSEVFTRIEKKLKR